MSYQSFSFIIFAFVVLLAYYIADRKRQIWVLALANLVFYISAGIQYLPFLLAAMAGSFFTARRIGRIYDTADADAAFCSDPAKKKQLRQQAKADAKKALRWGMLVVIGLLAVCKYLLFVLENLNLVLAGVHIPQIPLFSMILPVGISFYSFMALSYVLDVYWKRYRAENNFLVYAVYLSYFPHVVQGPIDRFNEFSAQIREGVEFSYQNLTFGAQLALWGFFKKLVVADRIGMFVDTVFAGWQDYSGFVLVMAVIVYSIQIYADFSGCIDIVTGVSEMLGIRLRKNFNHPYFSRSMGEFWRRWHISLQEWFKDYVYYPVSASGLMRRGKKFFREKGSKRGVELFATCMPILAVWMVTGIWHGAAWKYVAWGLFHAVLLIGSKVLEPTFDFMNRRFRIPVESFVWRLWQMLRTFFLCCVGRIFFRAADLKTAFGIMKKMGNLHISIQELIYSGMDYGISLHDVCVAAIAILVLLIVDILQEKMHLRETIAKRNIVIRWIIIFAGLFAVLITGIYGPGYDANDFIYEQF